MGKSKIRNHGTGMRDTWKLWRLCMCRHGWYPLIVAPFITTATFLDIYSTLDCRFIRVDIGFTPANKEWTKSTLDAGFWTYYGGNDFEEFAQANQSDTQTLTKPLFTFQGCAPYTTEFEDSFIEGDRAWTAAAIMAYCSGISGLTATATIWLMTICPLPACFVWPGVLLPAVLVGFLAGCAKFFVFDSVLCTNKIWLQEGSSERESALKCTLHNGAILSIASICCFLIGVCLIFYNVPEKRELDPDFGVDDLSIDDRELEKGPSRVHPTDQSMEMIPEDLPYSFETPQKLRVGEVEERESVIVLDTYSAGKSISEDRDDENDGLEAVMNKIGVYFKESGSDIDFENSISSIGESKSYAKPMSPSENEIRRVKSYGMSSTNDESQRSIVPYDGRKTKHRDKIPKNEVNSVREDEGHSSNLNKDDNQCDISAITIDNLNNTGLNAKDFGGLETTSVGSTIKSTTSAHRNKKKTKESYRVY